MSTGAVGFITVPLKYPGAGCAVLAAATGITATLAWLASTGNISWMAFELTAVLCSVFWFFGWGIALIPWDRDARLIWISVPLFVYFAAGGFLTLSWMGDHASIVRVILLNGIAAMLAIVIGIAATRPRNIRRPPPELRPWWADQYDAAIKARLG